MIRRTWRHAWAGGEERGLEAAAGGEKRRRRQQARFWQESIKAVPNCTYSPTAKVPDASHPAGSQIAISGGEERESARGRKPCGPPAQTTGDYEKEANALPGLGSPQHHPTKQEASPTGAARLPCKQIAAPGEPASPPGNATRGLAADVLLVGLEGSNCLHFPASEALGTI